MLRTQKDQLLQRLRNIWESQISREKGHRERPRSEGSGTCWSHEGVWTLPHGPKYNGAGDHREKESPSHPSHPIMSQGPTVGKEGSEPKSIAVRNAKELAKNT